jgi:acetyl esterase/lipase
MLSLRFRFTAAVASTMMTKKQMMMGPEDLKAAVAKYGHESKKCPKMFCRGVDVARVDSPETPDCPTYRIKPKAGFTGKAAVLYIHGGGYTEPVSPFHWLFASRIARHSGLPVYFPLYPQLQYTDNIEKQFSYVFSVYQALLKDYTAPDGSSRIILLGDSAGASMALSICCHITRNKLPEPLPGHLMLVSPADCAERQSRCPSHAVRG